MHLNRKGVAAVILLLASMTGASAQIPNPLDWIFPHKQAQPPGNSQPEGGGNSDRCSTQPHFETYLNDCGELIPGTQDGSPVHG